ncbi:MAG: hypothetical protein LBJ82_06825, partial [Deltaproteobacteria bacterium]|nr:hypothetical protein [Deltaproteobacteria bacterium]
MACYAKILFVLPAIVYAAFLGGCLEAARVDSGAADPAGAKAARDLTLKYGVAESTGERAFILRTDSGTEKRR